MPHVLAIHRVKDFDTWKKVFDDFADVRKASGETAWEVFQAEGDPNNVTVLFECDTLQHAKDFLASKELKSAMERAGVAETPNIRILNETAKGTF